jgi:hypothetical protein
MNGRTAPLRVAMPPNQLHGAGLRAFLAFFFDESYFGPGLQPIERVMEDAVPVEVNFAAVGRFKEAVVVVRKKLPYTSMRPRFMSFHGATAATDVILHLSAGGVEGVAQRHMEILVFDMFA